MKKRIFIILVTLPAILVLSGTTQDKTPILMAETFLNRVKEGNIPQAYDQLFEGSQIPVSKPQAVELMKSQTASALLLYGKIIGFEKLREEKMGASLVRLVYVLNSEYAPTVWEFYFYKPKSVWFLAYIRFNDKFEYIEAKQ